MEWLIVAEVVWVGVCAQLGGLTLPPPNVFVDLCVTVLFVCLFVCWVCVLMCVRVVT